MTSVSDLHFVKQGAAAEQVEDIHRVARVGGRGGGGGGGGAAHVGCLDDVDAFVRDLEMH